MAGAIRSMVEAYATRKVRSTTKAKDSTSERGYLVTGTPDLTHDTAEAYAKLNGPSSDQDLVRQSIDLTEVLPGYFKAVFRFAHPDSEESKDDQQPTDPTEFSFDTTGGTQHIQTSLNTVNSYGDNPSDYKQSIGVNGQNVAGVDIIVPQFKYTEKKAFTSEEMTLAFAKKISELTGKTNAGGFKGWAAGEVLFLGASGSQRNGGDWEVVFSFTMESNKTGLEIGDINGIDKKGHEYLWVAFKTVDDGVRNVQVPVAVYVEQVYEEGNFADLDIGA